MDTHDSVGRAVRSALVITAGFAVAPALYAQDAPSGSPVLEDRVLVTGSRIKRIDVETTAPLTVLSSEHIRASGLKSVGDILRNINQADSLGLSNLTNSTNGNDGTQTISLRGLGPSRTLVLVNGRRWLSFGGGSVDLTQIPVALVERVEILGDGASAIYGSDAVAGVVNIITRTDYDGLEVEFGVGSSLEGDGEHLTVGATLGVSGTRSAAFLHLSKTEQHEIWAGDREVSALPLRFVPEALGSAAGEFGQFIVPCGLVPHLTAPPCPPSGRRSVALRPDRVVPGLTAGERVVTDFEQFGTQHQFNFAPSNYLLTPSDRLTAYSGGHFDLTDTVRASLQLAYNQRKSAREIAAVPIAVGALSGLGPQWQFAVSGQNLYNPFGIDLPLVQFRMTPLGGGRRATQDFDTFHGTLELAGVGVVAGRQVEWDIAYSRGESTRTETIKNLVALQNLRNGLGPSFIDPVTGAPTCGTPAQPTPMHGSVPCVPLNLFNGTAGWTASMVEFVRYTGIGTVSLGLRNWSANVTGDLATLPAGSLAFAAGYERRENTVVDIPDSLVAAGLSSTNFREPTRGRQAVDEYYVEFAIPVLHALELSAAARRSEYDNAGLVGTTAVAREFAETSLKFGALLRPHDDLLFRAAVGDAFRAPTVSDLFAGGGESFGAPLDLCATVATNLNVGYPTLTPEQQARCHAQGVPVGGALPAGSRFLFGGNPHLDPERGTTTSIGVVYNPSWLDGLDISVDHWRVKLDDALGFRGPLSMMQGCIFEGDATDCSLIERDPVTGTIVNLRTGSFNVLRVEMAGVDVNANYRFDTHRVGSLTWRVTATWMQEAKQQLGALSDEPDNIVGRAAGPFGPVWRWRANVITAWRYGDYEVAWAVRFLSPLVENCSGFQGAFAAGFSTRQLCSDPNPPAGSIGNAINRVGSTTYHDLAASWRAPWNATLRVGMRNLFRKEPPFMMSAFANSFDQAYDVPGGFWFVSYRQQI